MSTRVRVQMVCQGTKQTIVQVEVSVKSQGTNPTLSLP